MLENLLYNLKDKRIKIILKKIPLRRAQVFSTPDCITGIDLAAKL